MMKDVEFLEFMWPMRTFLITCGEMEGSSNIIAVSFCMPASKQPPLLACAISKTAYSSDLIGTQKEFVVNVPLEALRRQIYFCGTHSGRDGDKFARSGLTPRAARRVKAPVIAECVAFMECTDVRTVSAGDKNLFVGEVVEAYADESLTADDLQPEFAEGHFPAGIYGMRFTR